MPDPAENATQTHTRELAAIMFSDVCNYTLIMGRDESAGVRARGEHRELLRSVLPKFNGRVVDEAGDGTLSSFRSAVDAVNCARHIQASLKNVAQFQVRIGIHVGDVIVSGNNVIGDGVNVASRIQALASPGGICISERVYDDIRNKPDISGRSLGEKTLKNVTRPIRVYEVTDSAQPTTAVLGVVKRPLVAALVVIIASITAIVSWKLLRPAGTPAVPREAAVNPQIRSIAVLPMENLSGDPNQEYFADGMTEELITDLAKISALRVISRTSVMQFKGERKKPLPEIAKALNVDAVVEGSVLRVGDKVRITTQLIDALADKHLWAESYERDSRDVLALQGELASAIAKQINIEVAPQERQRLKQARAVNPEAHEAYLKGRYFFSSPTVERTNKAIEQFQRAIKLDPDFALPYTGLADTYSWADDLYLNPMDVMPKAKAAAQMALHLDNSLAEAHASLGYVNYLYDYDLAASESEYKRSIELTPNYAFAHSYYGFLLSTEGRFDEAIAEGKLASDLDPLSSSIAVFCLVRIHVPRKIRRRQGDRTART
jgi:TolB-like protein/class 3 adenylate cyclase